MCPTLSFLLCGAVPNRVLGRPALIVSFYSMFPYLKVYRYSLQFYISGGFPLEIVCFIHHDLPFYLHIFLHLNLGIKGSFDLPG